MKQSKQVSIHAGMKIPLFSAGRSGPQIMSAEDCNVIVRALNALLNPKISRGAKDDVLISDLNTVYQLGTDTQATQSSTAATAGPLDSAIYVPAAGGHGEYIAGVRGSRIQKFDA